jgi:sulfate permease, SulP family
MTAGRTPSSAAAGTLPEDSRHLPVLQGVLPIRGNQILGNVLAGITLAALGIPEVLGYAKIAGMPVVTGLYTLLLPMAVFALVGSSRHLVVGADSATAAMMAAGLAAMAAPGSPRYVALAGLVALIAAALLLLARLVRLGFLADFLSRTVLIGFLTGVGIQVAIGQLAEMLGVHASGSSTVSRLIGTVRALASVHWPTVAVSASVVVLVVGFRLITRRIPGALVAVVGAIAVSRLVHLDRHGVAVLGAVPPGLPALHLPTVSAHAAAGLIGTSAGIFVVILAQSSATARAYAAKYDETFDENVDLVGLGLANAAAAVTGTFVVNGSPTKTEMVDSAGGRSQLAQLTTSLVVLVVLLFLTGPLAYLPLAVLATIVFLIGVEMVDVRGMRRILAVRRDEFLIALLTAAAVVFIGVEQGIVLAIVASIVDHLRIGYAPRNSVLVPASAGHLTAEPVSADARTVDGLVIYRFAATLYYANAHRLLDDVRRVMAGSPPPAWFCLDCVAVADVDFTAAAGLRRAAAQITAKGGRLVLSNVSDRVRQELDRYGITDLLGADAYYPTPIDVLHAFPGTEGTARPHDREADRSAAGRREQ